MKRPLACTLAASAAGIIGGRSLAWRFEDAYWYYQIASGNRHVLEPFANRQLDPVAARLLAQLHLSLIHSFELIGLISFVGFAFWIFLLLDREQIPTRLMIGVVLTSFWAVAFGEYMLPDTLNNFLLLVLITLLMRSQYMAAMLMLLPLQMSRETGVLVAACVVIAAWKQLRIQHLLAGAASLLAGAESVKKFSSGNLGNVHHLNAFVYLALKVPFNFSNNVLGIQPWANTLRLVCKVPRWSVPFSIGGIRGVGICGYSAGFPLYTASSLVCEFGLLVLPAWFVVRRLEVAPYLRFCIFYGAICFVLAPVIGPPQDRLVAYSWPLFLIAVPLILQEHAKRIPWSAVLLAGAASWSYLLFELHGYGVTLLIPLLLSLAAFLLLGRGYRTGGGEYGPERTTAS